ncbi:MAG TPA: class I SAM-dependent methyltransferase [Acidimicrobiales bacterium]|jgi:SAM-dependent methyltransferase
MSVSDHATDRSLAERVRAVSWYHTFDLPGGVTTVGLFDHRKFVHKLPLPASLEGVRCLDAAASDGFFGFELARRGATVVSLDLPDHRDQDFAGVPGTREFEMAVGRANQCFNIVKEATGLDVERVDGSLYDIESLDLGTFDLVFLGNVLIHLRDPIAALHQLHTVTGGELWSVEPISLPLTLLRPLTPCGQYSLVDDNTFWTPNLRGHHAMVRAGGYQLVGMGRPILQPMGRKFPRRPQPAQMPSTLHEAVYWGFTRQFGKTTSWLRARPL